MSCGVGHRLGSDPMLPWLWCRLVATTLIGLLAWEPPYAAGAALKRQKIFKISFTVKMWWNKVYILRQNKKKLSRTLCVCVCVCVCVCLGLLSPSLRYSVCLHHINQNFSSWEPAAQWGSIMWLQKRIAFFPSSVGGHGTCCSLCTVLPGLVSLVSFMWNVSMSFWGMILCLENVYDCAFDF